MQPTSPDKSTTVKAGVDLERVRATLAPVLAARGVELVEVEWLTDRGGWTLRVTIERPGSREASGGVTLEDCVEVSRDCSQVLDVDEDLIPQHYNLEVTSPGLDRKLRGPADFIRFQGKTAKVKLSRPAPDGQRVLRGTLEEATGERLAMLVDGKRIEVPAGDVEEARLVFELRPEPKKGKPKRSRKGDKGDKGDKSERGESADASGGDSPGNENEERGGPAR